MLVKTFRTNQQEPDTIMAVQFPYSGETCVRLSYGWIVSESADTSHLYMSEEPLAHVLRRNRWLRATITRVVRGRRQNSHLPWAALPTPAPSLHTNGAHPADRELAQRRHVRRIFGRTFGQTVAECMALLRSDSPEWDDDDVWDELVDMANNPRLPTYSADTVISILHRTYRMRHAGRFFIMRGSCGHVLDTRQANVSYSGTTVCDDCLDDCWYACLDGEIRHTDDCVYSEHRGGYVSTDEYYDDDDEDDTTPDGMYDWGADVGAHVTHTDHEDLPPGEFTLGIELEMEAASSRDRADAICDAYSELNPDYIVFKSDGSLSETRGLEMVTAARSLDDHISKLKDWVPHHSLTAWDSGCCGTHVHVDSRAFTPLSLGKFLQFWNASDNAGLIRRVAGRHPSQDRQAMEYARTINEKECVNPAKVKKCDDAVASRYRLVNLTNLGYNEAQRLGVQYNRNSKGSYSTVELRVFRASLNKKRLLAQIEMVHATVVWCREASIDALDSTDFRLWLAEQAKRGMYPHLAAFLELVKPKAKPDPAKYGKRKLKKREHKAAATQATATEAATAA